MVGVCEFCFFICSPGREKYYSVYFPCLVALLLVLLSSVELNTWNAVHFQEKCMVLGWYSRSLGLRQGYGVGAGIGFVRLPVLPVL